MILTSSVTQVAPLERSHWISYAARLAATRLPKSAIATRVVSGRRKLVLLARNREIPYKGKSLVKGKSLISYKGKSLKHRRRTTGIGLGVITPLQPSRLGLGAPLCYGPCRQRRPWSVWSRGKGGKREGWARHQVAATTGGREQPGGGRCHEEGQEEVDRKPTRWGDWMGGWSKQGNPGRAGGRAAGRRAGRIGKGSVHVLPCFVQQRAPVSLSPCVFIHLWIEYPESSRLPTPAPFPAAFYSMQQGPGGGA